MYYFPCYNNLLIDLQMEKDTINYMQYKMGFSQKLFLTDDAVPKKFHCQENRKSRLCDPEHSREVFAKRRRKELLEECEAGYHSLENTEASTSKRDDNINMTEDIVEFYKGMSFKILCSSL